MATPFQSVEMIDDAMADILRQKTSAERLAIANSMWRFARDMLRATLAREHPDLSREEIDLLVARRLSHGAI